VNLKSNQLTEKFKIAIFGGSFDPVHLGHIKIADAFLNSGVPDELWVMPTPISPFKNADKLTAYHHRLAMTRLAFSNIEKVVVSDYESRFIGACYTYITLRSLKESFPEISWYLCIGQDNLENFHKWANYREILEYASLLVAIRPGYKHQNVDQEILDKVTFVSHTPVDVSSTEIREKLKQSRKPPQISDSVFSYIKKNGLYKQG
jgi:nicotinate-nucleotide adenylyltransferase